MIREKKYGLGSYAVDANRPQPPVQYKSFSGGINMVYRSRTFLVRIFAVIVLLTLAACNAQPAPPPTAAPTTPLQAPSATAPVIAAPTATIPPQETATEASTATQGAAATEAPSATPAPTETQAPQSPTLAPGPTTLPTTANTQPASSNQPIVFDKAELIDKANIEDQLMSPGHSFEMSWTWRNVAHTIWTTDYYLAFYGGDLLGAKTKIDLPGKVNPGEKLELSVKMKVPDDATARSYHSFWALTNENGDIFNIVGLTIQVKQ